MVGGGPVGLAAALFLRKLGVKPRIIEKNTEHTPYSKALAINPRTLSLLSDVGATERILREGIKIKEAQMFFNEKLIFTNHLDDYEVPGNPYNFMTCLPQSRTEAILRELLKESGVEVEMGTALTKIATDDSQAQVTISKNNDDEQQSYDYVIGADGAKSSCRKLLNITYEGDTFKPEMYLSDFTLLNPPMANPEIHLWEDKTLVMFPVTKNIVRLISNYHDYMNLVPTRIKLKEEIWKSNFRVNHRVAGTFQKGRVFLAGDAAHIHSPVGGRGMNIGIEDVYVLTKLIDYGQTSEYTKMRKPIIEHMVRNIGRATELFLGKDGGDTRRKLPYLLPAARLMGGQSIGRFIFGLDHEVGI